MLITTTVYATLFWRSTNYVTQQVLSRLYSFDMLKNTSRFTMMDRPTFVQPSAVLNNRKKPLNLKI